MNDSTKMRSEEEILMAVMKRGRSLWLRKIVVKAASGMLAVGMLGGGTMLVMDLSEGDDPRFDENPTLINEDQSPKPQPIKTPDEKKKETPKVVVTKKAEPDEPAKEEPKEEPVKEPVKDEPAKEEPKLECLNSFNPDCGEFYWSSKPYPNQKLTINVDWANAIAGEPVTFDVRIADPDAAIIGNAYKFDFGDGTPRLYGTYDWACDKGYGKWTPPTRDGSVYERSFTHTFAEPGTYSMFVKWMSKDVRSGSVPCQQMYGELNYVSVEITVAAPPDPSPEPSPSEPVI